MAGFQYNASVYVFVCAFIDDLSRRHTDQFAQWAPIQKRPRSSAKKTSDKTNDHVVSHSQQMPSLSKADYQNVSYWCRLGILRFLKSRYTKCGLCSG